VVSDWSAVSVLVRMRDDLRPLSNDTTKDDDGAGAVARSEQHSPRIVEDFMMADEFRVMSLEGRMQTTGKEEEHFLKNVEIVPMTAAAGQRMCQIEDRGVSSGFKVPGAQI
jgi:hypothetical protein